MEINVEPTNVSFNITKVTYEIRKLIPNQSCEISAFLTESNGNRVKRFNLVLGQPEYDMWGTDDTFLINWICSQCGVIRAPVVEPVQEIFPAVIISNEIPDGFMQPST